MAEYDWIKKLTKDKKKKKGNKIEYDEEKVKKFKKSYGDRWKKLKEKLNK